jgi:hypothetical protein
MLLKEWERTFIHGIPLWPRYVPDQNALFIHEALKGWVIGFFLRLKRPVKLGNFFRTDFL